jgi:predicted nucleotidyltransferase
MHLTWSASRLFTAAAGKAGYDTRDMTAVPSLDQLRAALSDAPDEVTAVYLFGSVARDAASSSSDVDLGVLLRTPPRTLEGHLFDYQDRLQGAFRLRVHIVVLNDASADLVHRVLRDGQLLLERDRAARIAFEVRARNVYFDLLPVLTAYRRRVLARAAEGR